MDLIDDEPGADNAPEFTVSELSGAIKRSVEAGFSHIRVRGEVGRVSRPASGHLYLDLKDDRAVLAAVIWRGTARGLSTQPEQGMEVVATGRMTTFPGQSRYQLVIESLAPAGLGALMALLEARKKALTAEGLFAAERKRPLPYLPEVIGVVTSPSGAVIRDILHRLRDRFPRRVLVWPVSVQGTRCAAEVAAAIRGFDALSPDGEVPRPDLLIVARGGGSIEDLWGFNEEAVVRAAADCSIPLISAVGHETDTTLIDLAADMRAPTPSAAAELAVPVRAELLAGIAGLEERQRRALARSLGELRRTLRDLGRLLPRADAMLAERNQRLDDLGLRLPRSLRTGLQARSLVLERRAGRFGPRLIRWALDQRRAQIDRGMAGRMSPPLLLGTLRERTRALARLAARLAPARLQHGCRRDGARLAALAARLDRAGGRSGSQARDRLDALERVLESLSHGRTLDRGFALVRGPEGRLITSAGAASEASTLRLVFRDGEAHATPLGAEADPAGARAKPTSHTSRTRAGSQKAQRKGGQGELF
ncbi:MAG: exodeoxyribonuclease VII large subunit [Pseudomonadota bacterium]